MSHIGFYKNTTGYTHSEFNIDTVNTQKIPATMGRVLIKPTVIYPKSLREYQQVRVIGDGDCYYRSLGYAVVSELISKFKHRRK